MKRIICLFISVLFLSGCNSNTGEKNSAMEFRSLLLQADQCVFASVVTADYGDEIYSFKANCQWNADGTMTFLVTEPESIAGIRGNISGKGGEITFDEKALFFETIADGQISPISAPWVMLRALNGGYIKGCSKNDSGYSVEIDDSYAENTLNLNLQLDEKQLPVFAEVFWKGRRVVSIELENFKIL